MKRTLKRVLTPTTTLCKLLFAVLCLCMVQTAAHGASVRWVTSRPPWNYDGTPFTWNRNDLTYWVDNGPLSSAVPNATATTMVAAAAAVWNIQYSNLTLTQGGSLAEDVSSSNVYLGSSGPIWPADVATTNYTSKPIAVIFDADGTITDLLLGAGASAPTSCRQNAVTESVDLFIQPGMMAHAVIVLNGRCVGAAPEQLLQMQYQLMRTFGRVLGVGWSQLNDNVFTGAPQPTYQQQAHWPIMHPIDIVCGTYTYQCLPNPFTLRDDDKTALRLLYGVSAFVATNGAVLAGVLEFRDGSGMNGVNMVATRTSTLGYYGTEPWETTSAISGYIYRGANGNPVVGALTTFPALQGTTYPPYKGYWSMMNVPVIPGNAWNNVAVKTQALNPLYVGQYSIGPFTTGPVNPSGSPMTTNFYVVGSSGGQNAGGVVVPDAAGTCAPGSDGTAAAPAPVAAGGVWSGQLCGYGHSSWGSVAVQANRTATLEVMALDESGAATTGKAHPMLGIWHAGSDTGLPTLAASTAPFNGRQIGTTQLKPIFTTAETITFVIADERGEGRPDFTYGARFLYADSVAPAKLGSGGGTVRILGTGFQTGNTVTVGGVLASVTSLTPTEIDAVAPTLSTLGGIVTNDVVVNDLRTGGTATIIGGLVYSGASTDVLTVVQAPGSTVNTGVPSTFSVRLTTAPGVAEANTAVTFTVPTGSATYSSCGLSTCTVLTDSTGLATVNVTATYAGSVVLKAAVGSGATVSVQYVAVTISHVISPVRATEYVAAVPGAVFNPAVQLVNNGGSATGTPVNWTVTSGAVSVASATTNADVASIASVTGIGNLAAAGVAQITACAWTSTCTTLNYVGVSQDQFAIVAVSGDAQVVAASTRLSAVQMRVIDGMGHGVVGATVQLHQAVYGYQPACPATGRCPVPPLYGTTTTAAVTDDDGYFSATPLQYDGTAAVTRIVAATGTQGYLALSLTKTP